MRETKTVNNCVNMNDLTFVIGHDQYVGLGRIRFVVTQDVIEGIEDRKSVVGVFEPKDDEAAFRITDAWMTDKKIEIRGSFRDTLNNNKELDWRLENVWFSHINHGKSASFRAAVASEYPLGTFI
jgi:hypothetical protein